MALGFKFFEELAGRESKAPSDYAELLMVTPQAISAWKSANMIPSKRVSQLADHFGLSASEVDQLLGKEPLRFAFRAKNGQHIEDKNVSERMKVRAETIYERLFGQGASQSNYDLTKLKISILENKDDFLKIADVIRKEFTIPDYSPITSDDLFRLQQRIGAMAFFMPFKKLGLSSDEEFNQTAILYTKSGVHSILLDSDRMVDEAHFDRMHEIIHVFLDGVLPQSQDLEDFIDKICGELIYPKTYIIETIFNGDESSKPIKNKEVLHTKFYDEAIKFRLVLSPKGLARSMRDAGLTSKNSELYKYFYHDLHLEYRPHTVSYSTFGGMDFDFSDRESLLKFYSDKVESIEMSGRYPLFEKLKKDFLNDLLPPSDFADTFNLKLSDALVVKSIWKKALLVK